MQSVKQKCCNHKKYSADITVLEASDTKHIQVPLHIIHQVKNADFLYCLSFNFHYFA